MGSALVPTSQPIGVISPLVGLLPEELAGNEKDVFFWEFDNPNALAAAGGASLTITNKLTTEKHLLILGATAQVTDNATDTTLVPFINALVTWKDGTDRQLMSAGVPFSSFFGTAQLPSIMPWRKFIPAGSQSTLVIENLEATAYKVRVTFQCIAVYTGK